METKITFSNEGITFDPVLDQSTAFKYIRDILEYIPELFLHVCANVPLLRPACPEEQEAHLYVFSDGERGEHENKLYKFRKDLYEAVSAVFSNILTTVFPDIEYIESCKLYQQEFCSTNDEDVVKEFKANAEEVTKYVRENFNEILKNLMEVEDNEQTS